MSIKGIIIETCCDEVCGVAMPKSCDVAKAAIWKRNPDIG